MRGKLENSHLRVLCVEAENDRYYLAEQIIPIWSEGPIPSAHSLEESESCIPGRWGIRAFLGAIRETRKNRFDCIAIHIPEWSNLFVPLFSRNPLRNIVACLRRSRFYLHHTLLYLLVRHAKAKVVIFDRLDACIIDSKWHPFLEYCTGYLKRELPKSLLGAFLYSHKGAIEPWRNQGRFAKYSKKLLPLSEAIPDEIGNVECHRLEKDIDILWGGNVEINQLRSTGLESLHKLADLGFRVKICEGKIPQSEYYQLIERSYLVWSPDGGGWYCLRHFEACVFQSVPIVSWPYIWQDKPFVEGAHCFYYNPEGDDLVRVVEHALKDRERLVQMGIDGREFVLKYHTRTASYLRGLWRVCGHESGNY